MTRLDDDPTTRGFEPVTQTYQLEVWDEDGPTDEGIYHRLTIVGPAYDGSDVHPDIVAWMTDTWIPGSMPKGDYKARIALYTPLRLGFRDIRRDLPGYAQTTTIHEFGGTV